MLLVPAVPYVAPKAILDVINHVGLQSSLQLCLDAGDAASYDGTSQTWVDRSGNNNNFYRGTGSGSEASDPTFSGQAGAQSSAEHFGFDGADILQQTAAHTFANAWHKNNAVFTIAAEIYSVAAVGGLSQIIFTNDTFNSITDGGFIFSQNGSDGLNLAIANDSVNILTLTKSSPTLTAGAWNFVAVSLDESIGSNGAILQINSSQSLATSTYSSPSTSNPDNPLRIGRANDDTRPLLSGVRLAGLQAWNRALSSAELTALYNGLQPRFGF